LKKNTLLILLLFSSLFFCHTQNFDKGRDFFMQNKPSEARPLLEMAITDDPAHVAAWLYLGIVYEQLNRPDDAIATYKRILPSAAGLSANLACNIGNVYFKNDNVEMADMYYSQSIAYDSNYSAAYLGRANTKVKSGKNNDAITDYEQYLTLEPLSVQKQNIEQLILLIRAEYAAEERRKALIEEEERLREAERQRLMDEVSASLQSAVDSSKGISSGTENVEGYENEFELE
jgi:Tfp pilus assembly protein PilF